VAAVAIAEQWRDADIVVNLQGDEPLMPAALIDQVAAMLAARPGTDIATLAVPLRAVSALLDPNVAKVVSDLHQRALYFSRAPIPWSRDGAPGALASQHSHVGARRHLGIYAYRVSALRRIATLAPSEHELLEQLEQLRALDHGMDIRVADAVVPPGMEVNTPADLAAVEAILAARA
jgi:3-deoxy-manno-octulosonate cytidylyltransferase (CMP-KDO synthetase)